MIDKSKMIVSFIEFCPSFCTEWDSFRVEWENEDVDPPLYILLGQLARHLIHLKELGKNQLLTQAFQGIENWLANGDHYVREATTVGLIEDLQNTNLHSKTSPTDFLQFCGENTKRSWGHVERFWNHGETIPDD